MFKLEQSELPTPPERRVPHENCECALCKENFKTASHNMRLQLPPDYELDLKEACLYLGWKPQTMYNRIANGTAPQRHWRWGRWFFFVKSLDEFKRKESRFIK
jgi:hypothetical protein